MKTNQIKKGKAKAIYSGHHYFNFGRDSAAGRGETRFIREASGVPDWGLLGWGCGRQVD